MQALSDTLTRTRSPILSQKPKVAAQSAHPHVLSDLTTMRATATTTPVPISYNYPSHSPLPCSHFLTRWLMQEHINTGKGEAAAIEAKAAATASAIRAVAIAMQRSGGQEATAYRVAEQYIHAFGGLVQGSNTLVVPANSADVGSMVAQAFSIYCIFI